MSQTFKISIFILFLPFLSSGLKLPSIFEKFVPCTWNFAIYGETDKNKSVDFDLNKLFSNNKLDLSPITLTTVGQLDRTILNPPKEFRLSVEKCFLDFIIVQESTLPYIPSIWENDSISSMVVMMTTDRELNLNRMVTRIENVREAFLIFVNYTTDKILKTEQQCIFPIKKVIDLESESGFETFQSNI